MFTSARTWASGPLDPLDPEPEPEPDPLSDPVPPPSERSPPLFAVAFSGVRDAGGSAFAALVDGLAVFFGFFVGSALALGEPLAVALGLADGDVRGDAPPAASSASGV
ncbi:hypothetical protein ACQPXT_37880 [Streptomyces sp. CA-100214]